MKILMLVKRLGYSGAYKMFMWVSKALADRGWEVTVLTYMKSDVIELPSNIRWIKNDLEKNGLARKIRAVRRIAKEIKADICVSFLLDANIINTLACLGIKTKSVICERNDPYKPHYYKLKLTKFIFRLADGAVFQLPKVADFYSMIKGPTAVIPNPVIRNGIELSLLPFEKRENVIVSLARLDVFQKRQDVLIKAFVIFLNMHPDYILKLYGDGPDEEKLKRMVDDLGLKDKVMFEGVTNDGVQVLRHSKFFVLSSDFEGIPNALMEAMSIGLPCISTKCSPGGAEFLIEDGVNGLLVDKGDAEAIAKAMCMIAEDNIGDKLGLNAKKINISLSETIIADMWIEYLLFFKQ